MYVARKEECMPQSRGRRARWGSIKKLPSGRWQASYPDPSAEGTRKRITGPTTYDRRADAEVWLASEHALIAQHAWTHPREREETQAREAAERQRGAVTFKQYATQWVDTRTNSQGDRLASRTREEYRRYLTDRLSVWADMPINAITPDQVRTWHAEQLKSGKKTSVGRQYDLMKSVLKTAEEDGLIAKNPCRVRGGSKTSTELTVTAPTDSELDIIIEAMPEHLRYPVITAAAAGLRWGEIQALTRDDFTVTRDERGEIDAVHINVDKAEVRLAGGTREVKRPKSRAGVRSVTVFGNDARSIADHVNTHGDQLLNVTYSGFQYHWRKARTQAGRPDLHFHALRHYSGTRFAQAGATLAEIMAWLGHSDVASAMHYQEAAEERMNELARRAARN